MRAALLRRAIGPVAVASALLAAAGCQGGGDGEDRLASAAASADGSGGGVATAGTAPATLPTTVARMPISSVVAPPAPDPVTAVDTFLQAEVARDAETAWTMLSAEDRVRYPTPAMWQTEHRQIPQLTGGSVTGVVTPVPGDGTLSEAADLPGEVTFVPTLDTTKGLVPASASATWRVVRENGGWRVSYTASTFTATYPSDAGAADAAIAWAKARQACQPTGEADRRLEVVGGVVGISGLADRLCGSNGAIEPKGIVLPIATTDATAVIAAFGPGAAEWARVVNLGGPAPQRVVLGPLGDRWIAIGVLTPV